VIDVRDNPQHSRYEIRADGELVGFAVYTRRGDVVTFVHTEIDEAHEGHGYAGKLVAAALDDVRAHGLTVIAQCPYVSRYIREHDEYADLLTV
jgi:predicted GNAT family acetyltransferase